MSKPYEPPSFAGFCPQPQQQQQQQENDNSNDNDENKKKAQVKSAWTLQVLRDGVILEDMVLGIRQEDLDAGRTHLLLGRQADVVDIVLENPSISRQHAILQFGKDGSLHLFDLGSAQGTFVNKTQLSPNTYQKLFVGDMIKFAASPRIYVVLGPSTFEREEYNSANLEAFREKSAAKLIAKENKKANGVSWGMSYDEEEELDTEQAARLLEEQENDSKESSLTKTRELARKLTQSGTDSNSSNNGDNGNNISKQVLEKIKAKDAKISLLLEENRRIQVKEGAQEEGLTSGQMATIERNNNIIEKLQEELSDILHEHNLEQGGQAQTMKRMGSKKSKKKNGDGDDDDDADDSGLLDTTKQTADASLNWRLKRKNKQASLTSLQTNNNNNNNTNGGAVTHESLLERKQQLSQQIFALDDQLLELYAKQSKTKEQLEQQQQQHQPITKEGSEGEDVSLTSYMLESELTETKKKLRQLDREKRNLMLQLLPLTELIKATAPALSSLVQNNNSNNEDKAPESIVKVMKLDKVTLTVYGYRPTPSEVAEEERLNNGNNENENENEVVTSTPTPKPTATPAATSNKTTAATTTAATSNKTTAATTTTTTTTTATTTENPKKRPKTGPIGPARSPADSTTNAATTTTKTATATAADDFVWVPPKNQTGDGKTALNDKYGY